MSVGALSLLSFKHLVFLFLLLDDVLSSLARFAVFVIISSLYLWGLLPLSALRNCYFCVYRLLDLLFSLDLFFSLFSLYLWGPLPLTVIKNCYSCCCRLLALLFSLDLLFSSVLNNGYVKLVSFAIACISRHISNNC